MSVQGDRGVAAGRGPQVRWLSRLVIGTSTAGLTPDAAERPLGATR
jgi:hypothetical protein